MFEQPADFHAESEALHHLLSGPRDADFEHPTRFKQWTIRQVLAHLHLWNWAAGQALVDEPGFVRFMASVQQYRSTGTMRDYERQWVGALSGTALLHAWREQAATLARQFAGADPKQRLKWAGPDMSARSSITARLMETWAHGQAVHDLLGVERIDGDRIRNIVVLGVNTFGWTFTTHRQPVPAVVPAVRLSAPSGAVWSFNDTGAGDRIEGSATEFCQVVTQVRNIADTRLRVSGDTAAHWMRIAQCFAGAAETPPAPGTRFREKTPDWFAPPA
ncbi:MAG: TIGR03084 family metal-binding protein [Burkholderiales bacterium]|nr:TIGR03084 family metal-binding protein [Burkholderiales bacterium]